MRQAGVLLPMASLPSDYGIGDFGKAAFAFVDRLYTAGIGLWQILPLQPLGYGNSPYQPYSSYAGDEIYIAPDRLAACGLLKPEEPAKIYSALKKEAVNDQTAAKADNGKSIDYSFVRRFKTECLKLAFSRFREDDDSRNFYAQTWVNDYAVFLSMKKKNGLVCWNEWPDRDKYWICSRNADLSAMKEDIAYEKFVQYIFFRQWAELKNYANEKKIQIVGDIPFYVGIDSLDVWSNQECFMLTEDGYPKVVAGVPPDYFSSDGQRWGNPIYHWEYLKKTKFDFWIQRLKYSSKMFDIVRIDHFRAFDTYWEIPADCMTAKRGRWLEAPGYDFFDRLLEECPEIKIIVEDLGELREEVYKLRDTYGFMGMKILQFAFDPKENNNKFPDRRHMVLYTGTHDNLPVRGWFETQDSQTKKKIRECLKTDGQNSEDISWIFVRRALLSCADYAIIPMQDILGLGAEARINTPGTLGSPNWEWKMDSFAQFDKKIEALKALIQMSGRCL